MNDAALLEALPDLVAFLSPDGRVLRARGGRGLPFLQGAAPLDDRRLEDIVDAAAAQGLTSLAHRAIADRSALERELPIRGERYLVRVSAQ